MQRSNSRSWPRYIFVIFHYLFPAEFPLQVDSKAKCNWISGAKQYQLKESEFLQKVQKEVAAADQLRNPSKYCFLLFLLLLII